MSNTRLKGDKAITRFKNEEDKRYFVSVMIKARDTITDPPHPKMSVKDEGGYEVKEA